MDNKLGENGLKFFGAMTASISHEIKNSMAVINEHAGLLKDLVAHARQGYDMDIERLERLADTMQRQVGRADGIIRSMNRLGHSVDRIGPPANLNELLPLAAVLFRRMANRCNARLETRLPPVDTLADVSPFYLLALLRHCLEKTMRVAEEPYSVVLECRKQAAGTGVCFLFGPGGMADADTHDIAAGEGAVLAACLGAAIDVDRRGSRLVVQLPKV